MNNNYDDFDFIRGALFGLITISIMKSTIKNRSKFFIIKRERFKKYINGFILSKNDNFGRYNRNKYSIRDITNYSNKNVRLYHFINNDINECLCSEANTFINYKLSNLKKSYDAKY